METIIEIDKLEIAKWVINLEDKETLKEVALLMKQHTKPKYDAAYEATLSDEEKVKYWQEVGITGDELFNSVAEHIKTWPWKK